MRGDDGALARAQSHGLRISPTCVGTTLMFSAFRRLRIGSAPRAWETPRLLRANVKRDDRISPTCVGTTSHYVSKSPLIARISPTCVGTTNRTQCARRSLGSDQPHVRGDDRDDLDAPVLTARISPTCVGAIYGVTVAVLELCGSAPRAWGRTGTLTPHMFRVTGSAPRAWGRCIGCSVPRWPTSDQPHARGDGW